MADANEVRTTTIEEGELEQLAAIVGQALTFHSTMPNWMRMLGVENLRAVRRGDGMVGGLGIIWMGHWYGGKAVPAAGITAVGIAPEERGRGTALAMLRDTLQEIDEAGVPLSSLYPATVTLYRRAGYELAGSKIIYELPMHAIRPSERDVPVTRVGPEQSEVLHALYSERARTSAGNIDRTPLLWRRILENTNKQAHAYLIGDPSAPEGYAVFLQSELRAPLDVQEICALTQRAARRALTLVWDHRSMIKTLTYRAAPYDPVLALLPEIEDIKQQSSFDWMLRIVNVAGALRARGYPAGLRATLHLQVHDDILPQNNGRYILEVADGQGEVRQGGDGTLGIDIRGLAALYGSHYSPYDLRLLGHVDGPADALASAAALFHGPRPWIVEMF